MSDHPSVSVIVPCYNAEKTLAACLQSIYSQTFQIHEVIIIDDHSSDQSRNIARRYPCHLIESPTNRGVSFTRNTGVAASSGEILFFLDSDEALTPDSVANAVHLLSTGYDCVHGIIAPEPLVDDGPVEWYKTLHAYWWRKRGVGPVQTAFFAQAAMPRSVFDAVGPFDENLRDSEDLEYSDRLAPNHRILLTDQVVARHDEVDRLWPLLREQFRRSQLLVPTVLAASRKGKAALTANRPLGVAAVGLGLATLPLGLLSAKWLALPAICLLLFLLADPGLVSFAVRRKGWRFGIFFAAVHLITHIALVAGAVAGGVRWGFRRVVTAVVIVAAIVAMAIALRHDGPAAVQALARKEALPLVFAALAANIAGLALAVVAWQVLLAEDSERLRGINAAKVFFLGQLSKYLPGRVWGVVTHVQHGRDHGVGAARMTSAYLLSIGLTILTGAAVGLLAGPAVLGEQSAWLLVPTIFLLSCIAWPDLITKPLTAIARWVKRPITPPSRAVIRRALLLATVSWLVSGLHLWALAMALGADPATSLSATVGAFGLATVSGSLALIVPDGWGVREVVIMAALATVLPWSVAGVAAISSRVICIVAELVSSLVVLAWARIRSGGTNVQSVLR
ncbi:MAG TPA: hypothetical protein DGG94_13455 [Micromonosporaceae bacterium]|nr:hypothetical protein [Micromonosporaceae bacterium]HCU50783.1 hypothetical protein [Micromonosporaceae bacterium]